MNSRGNGPVGPGGLVDLQQAAQEKAIAEAGLRFQLAQASQNTRLQKVQHAMNFLNLFRETAISGVADPLPAIPVEIDTPEAKAARLAAFTLLKSYFEKDTPLESGDWHAVKGDIESDTSEFANAVQA